MNLLNLSSLLPVLLLFTQSTLSSKLTLTIPSSSILPNPHALPADTHATLTSTSLATPLKAPLTSSATFIFSGLAAHEFKLPRNDDVSGSYLLDIRSSEFVFAPLRVDVDSSGRVLGVWETFRGNEWGNRGVQKFASSDEQHKKQGDGEVKVDVRVVGRKGFYEVRQTFSPLSLFKNPMILLAIVALGFTFGMPKLMENMDPEMRAEFDKQSRASPISGAQTAMAGGGPANFDLAGWMAGAAPRGQETQAQAQAVSGPGAGAASGRENRGGARRR
ncbi:hypothetical protein BDW59DRAFT_152818 [Aspergillus cavernicola]|uniref:ER membrane protein complex subunit 7 beta-sandwich domain-containing protein n=1 Tax=Aspergillus cavernicola TaxID=176166 RepID=A0ABR4HP22_9EURO